MSGSLLEKKFLKIVSFTTSHGNMDRGVQKPEDGVEGISLKNLVQDPEQFRIP